MNNKGLSSAKVSALSETQKQYSELKEETPPEQVRTQASLAAARIKSKLENRKR